MAEIVSALLLNHACLGLSWRTRVWSQAYPYAIAIWKNCFRSHMCLGLEYTLGLGLGEGGGTWLLGLHFRFVCFCLGPMSGPFYQRPFLPISTLYYIPFYSINTLYYISFIPFNLLLLLLLLCTYFCTQILHISTFPHLEIYGTLCFSVSTRLGCFPLPWMFI